MGIPHLDAPHSAAELRLLADPYSEPLWLEYATLVRADGPRAAFVLNRAVAALPGSKALWRLYLDLPRDKIDRDVLLLYQRALAINNSPELWEKYIDTCVEHRPEMATQAFDGALFNLSESFHPKIWEKYLEYADKVQGDVGADIYYRHCNPANVNEHALKIARFGCYGKAVELAPRCSQTTLLELCSLIKEYPSKKMERFIDDGIARFPALEGRLLCILGRFFGQFDRYKAASLFQKALHSKTVEEVAEAFDAYVEVELRWIEANDTELDRKRLEQFLALRPLIINKVKLEQHKNTVAVWLERALAFEQQGDVNGQLSTFVEAISTINPLRVAKEDTPLSQLWLRYARVYKAQNDYKTTHLILSKAVKSQFASMGDLEELHTAWVEMILEKSDADAVEHLEDTLVHAIPANHASIDFYDRLLPLQARLFKSPKLWMLYLDLLRALERTGQLSKAFEKLVEIRVVSINNVLERANEVGANLWAVYEEGLKTFGHPLARFEIWRVYIQKTQETAPEKVGDLFERCLLEPLPAAKVAPLYDAYYQHEDKALKKIRILESALKKVDFVSGSKDEQAVIQDARYAFYTKLIDLVSTLKDPEWLRTVYAQSLEDHLTLPHTLALARAFVDFELSQNEPRRANAILRHVCGLGDPELPLLAPMWLRWRELGDEAEVAKFYAVVRLEWRNTLAVPMGFVKSENAVDANPDAIDVDMDM